VSAEERNPASTLEALERTGERFRELLEAVPAVIYEAEPGLDANWHYISPQLRWLTGDDPDEWIADPTLYTRRLHPEDRDAVFHSEEREFEIARGEGATCVSEYRMLHNAGHVIWVRDEARLMQVSTGKPFWRGVLVDITQERAAKHALAETFQRYQSARDADWPSTPVGLAGDVFRLNCARCGAVHAANRPGPCFECGSQDVSAESMNHLVGELKRARGDVDDLLDGIHRHLDMLGTSLHGTPGPAHPRVVTLLPDEDQLAG
jgi:PAS domain S-box-containing protein